MDVGSEAVTYGGLCDPCAVDFARRRAECNAAGHSSGESTALTASRANSRHDLPTSRRLHQPAFRRLQRLLEDGRFRPVRCWRWGALDSATVQAEIAVSRASSSPWTIARTRWCCTGRRRHRAGAEHSKPSAVPFACLCPSIADITRMRSPRPARIPRILQGHQALAAEGATLLMLVGRIVSRQAPPAFASLQPRSGPRKCVPGTILKMHEDGCDCSSRSDRPQILRTLRTGHPGWWRVRRAGDQCTPSRRGSNNARLLGHLYVTGRGPVIGEAVRTARDRNRRSECRARKTARRCYDNTMPMFRPHGGGPRRLPGDWRRRGLSPSAPVVETGDGAPRPQPLEHSATNDRARTQVISEYLVRHARFLAHNSQLRNGV